MTKPDFDQFGPAGTSGLADFVPVVFADSLAMAERLRKLLEGSNIPTLIEAQDIRVADADSPSGGIPLLVPTEMFDEATEVLAALDDEDEFDEDDADDDDEDFDDYDDEDDDDLFDDDDDDGNGDDFE